MMMRSNKMFTRWTLSFLVSTQCLRVFALIAYDCGGANNNYTIINSKSVQTCKIATENVVSNSQLIQLIEMSDTFKVKTITCLVQITRLVTYCGMHSHSATVEGGYASFIYRLGRDRCTQAESTGVLSLYLHPNHPITFSDLIRGQSRVMSTTFAGKADRKGNCEGSFYNDDFGSWDNVVVTGTIKVTIQTHDNIVSTDNDKIHLASGLSCRYTKGTCEDAINGETYWNVKENDNCHTLTYKVLYEGPATISYNSLTNVTQSLVDTIATVNTDQTLFSFKLSRKYNLCHLDAYTTDHPKLIVVRQSGSHFYHKKNTGLNTDLDLFTYINSKFVFIERSMTENFVSLYNHINNLVCENRRKTLYSYLAFVHISSTEFAYLYNEGPGVTGTTLGEVIYLTKCTPVFVSRRPTTRCYQQLPVTYNNDSYYMTPKYHTLVKRGTEIGCNHIMPALFELENSWWQISTNVYPAPAPLELSPNDGASWKFKSPQHLATAGIYSEKELNQLRDHIMYGDEREAIGNVLVRSFTGSHPDLQGGDFSNMMDEHSLETLGSRLGKKIWGWFSVFGNLAAGVIGILSCIQLCKWIADTIIHGKALYDIYGWSLAILAAGWDSLTLCLLHKHQREVISSEHSIHKSSPHTTDDNNATAPIGSCNIEMEDKLPLQYHMKQQLYPLLKNDPMPSTTPTRVSQVNAREMLHRQLN